LFISHDSPPDSVELHLFWLFLTRVAYSWPATNLERYLAILATNFSI